MSKVLVTESSLSGIAAAIRAKNGSSDTYKPGQMAAAIEAIPTGTTPTGTINITQNGTVNVTDYASADVAVPNTYDAGDEGKVVSNGALIAQTARASEITTNGTYDTTTNNEVVVNVPSSGPVIEPLSVTQNGTYTAPTGKAYSPVAVNVSGGISNLNFYYGRLRIDTGVITESDEYCYSDLIPINQGTGRWFLDLARGDMSSYYIGISFFAEDEVTNVGYIRQYEAYRSYSNASGANAKFFRIANKVSNLSFASVAFLVGNIHVVNQTSAAYKSVIS